MSPSTDQKIRITTEAVGWVERLEATTGPEIEDQFSDWVLQSPLHLPEFLKQRQIEAGIRHIQAERMAQRQAVPQSAVAPFVPALAPHVRWKTGAIAAAVMVALTSPLMAVAMWRATPVEIHSTRGAPADVVLPDGSIANLYQDTVIRARSLAGFSEITLESGGAKFHVRHRLVQWFQVRAGEASITATGTAFNVMHKDARIGVYVSEGSVRVERRHLRASLQAGQSAEVSAHGLVGGIQLSRPLVSSRSGASSNISLAALADEINRLSLAPQIVVERTAREQRYLLSGGIDGPEELIAALATYPDIRIERQGNIARVSRIGANNVDAK